MLLLCLLLPLAASCSPDVTEISDLTLIMAVGIDYDEKTNRYTLSTYNVMPTSQSTERSAKLTGWVVSASGSSLLETARNLRGLVGNRMIWQHNKFALIGEEAARHSFYGIMDFLMRNRQVRLSSYLIVSEGKASDKLNVRSASGDLLSNDLLGKVRNEKEWGKSIMLSIQEVANWQPDPYRGFVTGKVGIASLPADAKDELSLGGGAVFDKGKFKQWIKGDDVLVVQLLSHKNRWRNMEFVVSVGEEADRATLFFKEVGQSIHTGFRNGRPCVDIALSFTATMGEIDRSLPLDNPAEIGKLEQSASRELERRIDKSLAYFQHDVRTDVLGFSELFAQRHPKHWAAAKANWEDIYPTMPVNVHADVKIDRLGMIQYSKGQSDGE
ncbi:germination protein, Ger(x)C family [Cohnella sp. OV330]|uniref:Ger(x)C family spore germination protein n=1 Tax=Cohnella sp. OV330 TaxID=1855288 RepID=UPI0008F42A8D|nr:Ger(x)C family spore germination protein [Cohnella sp. OV330]SFB60678.1 germination protein, Ger(x)C family [Cohnella sp. OV330]